MKKKADKKNTDAAPIKKLAPMQKKVTPVSTPQEEATPVEAKKEAPKAVAEKKKPSEEKAAPKKAAAPSNKSVAKKAAPPNKSGGAVSNANPALNSSEKFLLKMENITKTFLGGKIVANDDITLGIRENEIHAIVGENGSGKSTLMNIIFGLYKQDSGKIRINGKKVDMFHSGASKKHRIGMVHQHFHLVEEFNVLENVIIGQEELSKSSKLKKKLKEYRKELKLSEKQLKKLKKLESMKIVHNDQGAQTTEADTNFVAAVLKILNDRHEAQLVIEEQYNLVNKLKIEKSRLSEDKKSERKRIEQIEEEMFNRRELIKAEESVVELVNDYEYNAKNEDQVKAVQLGERIYFLKREIGLLDVKLTGLFGRIKKKEVLARLMEIQIKYNLHLDPFAKIRTLSVGQRQMVEILKVLWEEKNIIVFDEPTATLSVVEIEALMKTFDALKKEGKTIIFISHKLQEVKAVADRVSVLRKGVMMGTYDNTDSLKPADIGELMVGKTIDLDYPARTIEEKPVFKLDGVSYKTSKGFEAVRDVSFEIYEGEIFGLAGIEGNGQEEIIKMITNLRRPTHGTISILREVDKHSVLKILKKEEKEINQTANEKIKALKAEHKEKTCGEINRM